MIIWSFVLAAVGITGVYLAGKQNYWGWGLGVVAQALWATYAVVTGQWGFLFTCAAYAYIYGKNFFAWSPGPIFRLGKETITVKTGGPITPAVMDEILSQLEEHQTTHWIKNGKL